MKIPLSLRSIYSEKRPVYEKLRTSVDRRLGERKEQEWHYISRVKKEESFALKVEMGRDSNFSALEDFFACTLVVPTSKHIGKAEDLVRSLFDVRTRRPADDAQTHKHPHSFEFDDLRLYVAWEDDKALPPTELDGIVFEVQIKTFLQHAWAIATHDLVYKSSEVDWGKERIAFQVKAMLEHAEACIQEADAMANSPSVKKVSRRTKELSALIEMLGRIWENKTDLPADQKRLAMNILCLLERLKISPAELEQMLVDETYQGRGAKTLNLSPYGIVIQSILKRDPERLISYMTRKPDKRNRVFITREIELPESVTQDQLKNTILCN